MDHTHEKYCAVQYQGRYPLISEEEIPVIVEITNNEKELLKRVLTYYLSELRGEIVKTEAFEWKKALHAEKDSLVNIVKKLS